MDGAERGPSADLRAPASKMPRLPPPEEAAARALRQPREIPLSPGCEPLGPAGARLSPRSTPCHQLLHPGRATPGDPEREN